MTCLFLCGGTDSDDRFTTAQMVFLVCSGCYHEYVSLDGRWAALGTPHE
jgi:hypothetical protein